MDHLLHVLDHIEELLRELIVAEVRGAMIELKGLDVIHSLVHVCCELVNTFPEGEGLPPFPKTIREKGVHLELEKEVVGREGVTFVTAFPYAIDEETLSIPESLPASFTPTSNGFVDDKSLLVVYGFYFFPTFPSGPPWNEGHQPRVHHETSVLEVPAPGTTQTLLLFKLY